MQGLLHQHAAGQCDAEQSSHDADRQRSRQCRRWQGAGDVAQPAPNGTGDYVSAEISTKFDPSGAGNNLNMDTSTPASASPAEATAAQFGRPSGCSATTSVRSAGPPAAKSTSWKTTAVQPGANYSTLHGPASGGGDYNGGSGVGSSYTLARRRRLLFQLPRIRSQLGTQLRHFFRRWNAFVHHSRPPIFPSGATWVFNGHPFYIILDVNEGGNFAPGTITSTQTMYVDYVHASAIHRRRRSAWPIRTSARPPPPARLRSTASPTRVNGGGTGIGGTSDKFNFDSQLLSGNFTLVTSVDWVGDTGQYAKGGLWSATASPPTPAYAFIQLNPANGGGPSGNGGATFEYRNGAGATAITAGTDSTANLGQRPDLAQACANGNAFTAYDSTNGGSTWNQIGPSETIAMNSAVRRSVWPTTADSSFHASAPIPSRTSASFPARSATPISAPPAAYGDAGFTNSTPRMERRGRWSGHHRYCRSIQLCRPISHRRRQRHRGFPIDDGHVKPRRGGHHVPQRQHRRLRLRDAGRNPAGGLTFEWRSSAGSAAQSVSSPPRRLRGSSSSAPGIPSPRITPPTTRNWNQIGVAETVDDGQHSPRRRGGHRRR